MDFSSQKHAAQKKRRESKFLNGAITSQPFPDYITVSNVVANCPVVKTIQRQFALKRATRASFAEPDQSVSTKTCVNAETHHAASVKVNAGTTRQLSSLRPLDQLRCRTMGLPRLARICRSPQRNNTHSPKPVARNWGALAFFPREILVRRHCLLECARGLSASNDAPLCRIPQHQFSEVVHKSERDFSPLGSKVAATFF